ncbi:UDP-N-acetylglucosamine 1-carboxyvinyltransferase [Tumebacillus sp. ITR2]|uniref:UDP-N-acetylglucosamine 1-carboxyvinyltransferase n=1 Tax=Tumebacillus amylolyticus TaxID=2801339 RepID=A0ABS1J5A1_9BACL|nr:UDP-N-acetylglucosamine 1-carboxyvinyltransferase [Tumebacillus amylolyticus]MBL0385458.1 UDP-N-acetylglucosamine 1-carboxyvinyltransferase [Tumebacillus amylolyticus]
MALIVVQGGQRLEGTVRAYGAKNAVLPILAATLLPESGASLLDQVPPLSDVYHLRGILDALGCVTEELGDGKLRLTAQHVDTTEAPTELVSKLRASFLVMGPLLARFGKARVGMPGGCSIGSRPIDLHLEGFAALGAEIEIGETFIEATAPTGRLKGASIPLRFASVGATQNLMMAAVLAEGKTVIENAACEPEIVDLADFLNAMGADVRDAGTATMTIYGVDSLRGANHSIIPDRIEAGTFLVAGAITGGNVLVEGAQAQHLRPVIEKLREAGAQITEEKNALRVVRTGRLRPLDVTTGVHPGYPTDMQAQMSALLAVTPGTSYVTETVFENRFQHFDELALMGANVRIDGRTAVVTGVNRLQGADVTATDLRAGAAMILAGLVAEGETRIHAIHHIERGYVDVVERFRALGADLRKTEDVRELQLK